MSGSLKQSKLKELVLELGETAERFDWKHLVNSFRERLKRSTPNYCSEKARRSSERS